MKRLALIILSLLLATLMFRRHTYNVLPRCGVEGCSVWIWIDMVGNHQASWEIRVADSKLIINHQQH